MNADPPTIEFDEKLCFTEKQVNEWLDKFIPSNAKSQVESELSGKTEQQPQTEEIKSKELVPQSEQIITQNQSQKQNKVEEDKIIKNEFQNITVNEILYVVDIYKEMGNEYFKKEKYIDSLSYYNKALDSVSDYQDNKSDQQLKEENFDEKIKPPLIKLYSNVCICNLKLNKVEEALEYADEVLDLDPNNMKATYNRGKCLRGLKRYKEALKNFQLCLNSSPCDQDLISQIKECEEEYNKQIKEGQIETILEKQDELINKQVEKNQEPLPKINNEHTEFMKSIQQISKKDFSTIMIERIRKNQCYRQMIKENKIPTKKTLDSQKKE